MLSKYKIQIPIFITIRGNNEQAILRNKEALKYAYVLIRDMNLFTQVFIISDNKNLINYAKNLGFIHTIYQKCENEHDITYLDYKAIYNFYLETNFRPDWIILMAVNQLFRNSLLISDCIQNIDYNYDVIASYTVISNRSNFFIKDNHITYNGHLTTHERDRQKMVDASIYAIKTDFAIYCMKNSKDPSELFWKGKFKFFENRSPYTDIYDINDINKYSRLYYLLDEVKKIKVDE